MPLDPIDPHPALALDPDLAPDPDLALALDPDPDLDLDRDLALALDLCEAAVARWLEQRKGRTRRSAPRRVMIRGNRRVTPYNPAAMSTQMRSWRHSLTLTRNPLCAAAQTLV